VNWPSLIRTRRSAFTLIEVICVSIILMILAAIATPVVVGSIFQAKVPVAASNLHQLHLALKLYQYDYDGDGKYGKASEMGLPDKTLFYGSKPILSCQEMLFRPPCGVHPDFEANDNGSIKLTYGPQDSEEDVYYPIYKEDSILLLDENCTDHSVSLYDPLVAKLILGVRLSGQLGKLVTRKYPDSLINWNDPNGNY
jgi:prepilin-type N-terminal cleavage/methylation domain-containing protein